MLNKNIVTFIGCESEYEDAKIVLYGAPFDSTTSFRPAQDLEVPRSEMSLLVWRHTVRIRTKN